VRARAGGGGRQQGDLISLLLSSRKEIRPIKKTEILSNIIILFTRVQILCYISKGKIYVQNKDKINMGNWVESQRNS
jgi:hypothetical protein